MYTQTDRHTDRDTHINRRALPIIYVYIYLHMIGFDWRLPMDSFKIDFFSTFFSCYGICVCNQHANQEIPSTPA